MMMRISHLGGANLNFRKGPIIVAETIGDNANVNN